MNLIFAMLVTMAVSMFNSVALFLLQTPAPSPSGTPSRVLQVAAISFPVVYIVIQLIKKWSQNADGTDKIGGIGAIALNFLLSAGAYMLGLPMDQWFTMATLVALATSVSAAAGLQGTVKNLTNK